MRILYTDRRHGKEKKVGSSLWQLFEGRSVEGWGGLFGWSVWTTLRKGIFLLGRRKEKVATDTH